MSGAGVGSQDGRRQSGEPRTGRPRKPSRAALRKRACRTEAPRPGRLRSVSWPRCYPSTSTQIASEALAAGVALERWLVADNSGVAPGTAIAAIAPSPDELWEGLRALFLIGQKSDLPLVENLAGGRAGVPDYIRKQAQLTARAIRNRNPQ